MRNSSSYAWITQESTKLRKIYAVITQNLRSHYAAFTQPLRRIYAAITQIYADITHSLCSRYAEFTQQLRRIYADLRSHYAIWILDKCDIACDIASLRYLSDISCDIFFIAFAISFIWYAITIY